NAKPIGDGLRDRLCVSRQQGNLDAHVGERLYRWGGAVAQLVRYQNGSKIAASLSDQHLGALSAIRSLRQVDAQFREQSPVADYGLLSTDRRHHPAANPILEVVGMGSGNILLLCKANDGATERVLRTA